MMDKEIVNSYEREYVEALEKYITFMMHSDCDDLKLGKYLIRKTEDIIVSKTFQSVDFNQVRGAKKMGVARGTYRSILKRTGIIK